MFNVPEKRRVKGMQYGRERSYAEGCEGVRGRAKDDDGEWGPWLFAWLIEDEQDDDGDEAILETYWRIVDEEIVGVDPTERVAARVEELFDAMTDAQQKALRKPLLSAARFASLRAEQSLGPLHFRNAISPP